MYRSTQRRFWLTGLAASAVVASTLGSSPLTARADTRDLGRMSDYIKLATQDPAANVIKNRWFVEVAGNPMALGASAGQVSAAQDAVVKAAAAHGVHFGSSRRYSRTFNGMAVTMDAKQAVALEQVPGVVGIYPVVTISQPVTPGKSTQDASSDAMSGVSIARDDLGYTGKGIKVGVIDTGIDIDHPDLGGSGTNGATSFPTKKVAYGYDFVGDNYNADDPNSVPVPDAVPDDCKGHGTHVAGIIGANGDPAKGGVRGVAPDVTLGAYRIFGCKGTTSSELIMAAMDRAEADGMDVVNMSLGGGMASWPDYPEAKAADALTKKGVIVVAAAGNDGDQGVFSDGAPSTGSHVISVASYDNTQVTANAFTVSPDGKAVGYLNAQGSPIAPLSGSFTLAAAGAAGTPAALGCDPYPSQFAPGTVVLVQRGTCSFRQKALNAQQAGAAGVILYNNQPGTISPTVEGDPAITIPVVMISQADGTELAQRIAAGTTTIQWTNQTVKTPNVTGGQVSDFSSYGLAADLSLKPDLGAPGGSIWSTYPLEQGGHASDSGTSMATPFVSGSIALLLQARPELKGKADTVRALLQNTATHDAVWSLNPKLGLVEPVIRQGAGLIQIDRAILTQQSITPSKISLGDDASGKHSTVLTFRNTSSKPVVYTLSNQTSIGTLGTSDPTFDLLDANVSMPTQVVVKAHNTAKVRVTITAPTDAPNGYIYGGWLVATSPTATTLNVPYVGMAGDYKAVSILTAPGSKAPCLGQLDMTDPANPKATCLDDQSAGKSYSMAAGDQPVVVFRVEYPVKDLHIDVYKANADGTKGELLGNALTLGESGRIAGDVGVAWDGTYQTTGKHPYLAKASAGSYILEVSALHATGSAKVASDWERWDSPAFTATFAAATPAATTQSGTLGTGSTTSAIVPANR